MDGGISASIYLYVLFLVLTLPLPSIQGPYERALLREIFSTRHYDKLERPVANDSESLKVQLGLTLQQIIDVDEKNQIVNTNIWLNLAWTDYQLTWNSSQYGGITKIRVPPENVWRPDILMYNSADEKFDGTFPVNVVIQNTGEIEYIPPGIFKSTCKINIKWFPFDDQRCNMKFGSWTHDGTKINLVLKTGTEGEGGDISTYTKNGEWDLIGVPAKRNVFKYDCCPEPYFDIEFTIHIRRRTLYYGFNLIIPCVLISSMALLTFTLPPDAGEKISLGVTILLSLTVFLLLVAEAVPPTSDAVPLIGMYFACIMIMCSLSVVFTVLVLNYHHRSAETHEMPGWVRKGICEWLAWFVRMKRPGRDISRQGLMRNSSIPEVEMVERSSKSLLANVLDLDDDIRSKTGHIGLNHIDDNIHMCQTRTELNRILKELRVITDKIKDDDEAGAISNDWKFAAMVIDRLCLIMFTLFTCLSTILIFVSAPHFFDIRKQEPSAAT